MNQEALKFMIDKTQELVGAPTCSSETRAAAQVWLDFVGTEKEVEETKRYLAQLQADIMPVDNLIGFAESEGGIQVFGADTARSIAAHAKEIKSAGAKYCDCPACAAVAAILAKKDQLF